MMMKQSSNSKGAVTLIMVLIVSVLLVFLTAGWQSRLLLSMHRARALSDVLVLTYHAESRIYDLVARFLHGFANAFSFPHHQDEVLADGTVLEVIGTQEGRVQTLTVTAKRVFGTTKLQVVREDLSSSSERVNDTDIVFVLDCTGSMGEPACDGCETTRMDEQKKAVIEFLDKIGEISEGRIRVGISAFAMKSNWLYTAYTLNGTPMGEAVKPDANLTLEEIAAAVNNGFGSSGESSSPACKQLLSGTSIGSGLVFAHSYMQSSAGPGKKQIEILITDGEPNQRIPYADCPVSLFCPVVGTYCCPSPGCLWSCPEGSGISVCEPFARDFLRCALAGEDVEWEAEAVDGTPEYTGVRDPNVDVYTVTVMRNPPANVKEIFESYSTSYFDLDEAAGLSDTLGLIFEEIVESLATIKIYRVEPTPMTD